MEIAAFDSLPSICIDYLIITVMTSFIIKSLHVDVK